MGNGFAWLNFLEVFSSGGFDELKEADLDYDLSMHSGSTGEMMGNLPNA